MERHDTKRCLAHIAFCAGSIISVWGMVITCSFSSAVSAPLSGKTADRTLVTVGKRKITAGDFVDFYKTRPRIAQWSSANSNQNDPKEALDALIGKVLMAEEARRLYPDTLKNSQKELADFEQTLLINMVSEEQIDKGIKIHEREVEQRIPENQKVEVHLRRIVTATREEALRLRKQLETGADFSSLAKKHSLAEDAHKGGDIGYMSFDQGLFPKKVVEEIFQLKKGEISGPAIIREGYALFQVAGRRKATAEALERVKQYIRQQISLERKRERWDQLLRQLSEESRLVINEALWKEIEQAIVSGNQGGRSQGAASALARMSGLEIARVGNRTIRLTEIIPDRSDPSFAGERPWEKDPSVLRRLLDRKTKTILVADYARQLHYDQSAEVKKNIARFKDDLMTRRLVAEGIYKDLTVSLEECQKYYQEHQAEYQVPERVKVSCITVADEKTAADIIHQLNTAAQLSELSKKYPPPPDSLIPEGFWARGGSSMGKEFEDRVFGLRTGEVSKPIKTTKGFHVVKLLERQSEGFARLDEVKSRIRDMLLSAGKEKALNDHIAALRRKTRVVVNEPLFQKVVKDAL